MQLIFKILIITLPTSFILMFYFFLNENDSYPGANFVESNLPEFKLESLENNEILIKNSLGGDFILNVWASWCITCRVEHSYLMDLSNDGIPIVGLNYKDERIDGIEWIKKYGNPYQLIIHDLKGSFAMDLGVTGAPETFLIHDGKIVAHYQGEVNKMIWNDVFMPIIEERGIF